jgi:hypothetical protein
VRRGGRGYERAREWEIGWEWDLVHGQKHKVFAHDDVVEMWREIHVHERPEEAAGERGQEVPVVDEDDAALACGGGGGDDGDGDCDGDGEGDGGDDGGGGSIGDGGGGGDIIWSTARRSLPLKECFSIAMSWSRPLRDGTPDVHHTTRHTSHVTRHKSHVTRHTSHVTRHTSSAL